MASSDTEKVLNHHLETLQAKDLDGIMADYADDAVIITNVGGVVNGLDAIRGMFSAVELPGFESSLVHVEDDYAFIVWKSDGVAFGTDTFVVQDGKITLQTAAIQFAGS
jgi:ketosteroid isomerase-like protein